MPDTDRERISHAEFARFVQEAKDMRAERDAARAQAEHWRRVAGEQRRVIEQVRRGLGLIDLGQICKHGAPGVDALRIKLAIERCVAVLAARPTGTEDSDGDDDDASV